MHASRVSRRRFLRAAAVLGALAASHVRSQASPKRVGVIGVSDGGTYNAWKARFPAEFSRLGFVDGTGLKLLWYDVPANDASGRRHTADELRDLGRRRAREMAADGLDCLVANGEPHTRFLAEATRTIPIVAVVPDPVALGFAKTIARPLGNVTGLHAGEEDVAVKRVELLRRIDPKLACVGWIGNENFRRSAASLEAALRAQGLRFVAAGIGSFQPDAAAKEVSATIARMRRDGCEAVHVEPFTSGMHSAAAAAALEHRVVLSGPIAREVGFLFHLVTRRTDAEESVRRVPAIVARILRGESPARIPFEGPSRYFLSLNLRTAARLGLRVPPDVVLRADEVIPE